MPSKRKFHRTLITIEILSEDPIPPWMELKNIVYECEAGDFSGTTVSTVEHKVNGKKMAKLLLNQASSPEFFRLDKDGNDID